MEGKEKWQDLGCIEADAVPARGCGLRLRVVVEGDGAVVEPREVQRLPPRSIPNHETGKFSPPVTNQALPTSKS
jgi:hypothetical protein